MENELGKYPKNYPNCPCCGSTERQAGNIIKKQKEEGKAGPNIIAFVHRYDSTIADMSRVLLTVPILSNFMDICEECGTMYSIHSELNQGQIKMKGITK